MCGRPIHETHPFAGRGAERGPELIMTDDDSVSILCSPSLTFSQPPTHLGREGPCSTRSPNAMMKRAGQTQIFVTDNEDIFAKADKVFRPQLKKPHTLAKTVESNESAPNRHTKQ